ncbi:MAG TPA: polysaccharide deacetylase family protein [Flavisolibacter sp.]
MKKIALVFTGDEYADGGEFIHQALLKQKVSASFFFTGRFYRNPGFRPLISRLRSAGHYLGAHSNEHLLYCDWTRRDSLLVNELQFKTDLLDNYAEMTAFGIQKNEAHYFLPPYEWYNDTISQWTKDLGFQLVNFTPGTLSHADYTLPTEKNYRGSRKIYESILNFEKSSSPGLNGFILLMHIGTHPGRTDKFYKELPGLIQWLRSKAYEPVRIDELLQD